MKPAKNQGPKAPGAASLEKDPSLLAQADRAGNRNEDLQSEYTETISVASFSDTDEELMEIERREYPPGMEGKEQAYRDIERVFDELESDKLLDPFTRWKPKEDPPETKKRTKFVPKRPLALPRRVPSTTPSQEVVAKKSSKTVGLTATEQPAKTSEKVRPTEVTVKKSSLPAVNITTHTTTKKKSSLIVSPRKSIVAELIMQANEEEARRKKEEEERLAKEQEENLARLRSNVGSATTTVVSEDRPQTQSSGMTEFDESDSQGDGSRPATNVKSRPMSRDNNNITINEIQKYAAGTFLDEKQRLSKDEYVRKGQVEMRQNLKTLHNLSPLVTNEDDWSTVETGPKGTTITTTAHKTQYELKVDEANAANALPQRQLTRQEELILELAQPKDTKKKTKEIPFLESTARPSGKKREEADKTMFKIVYKEPKWPHQVTLDKMVDRLFRVKHLILDDSQLKSLRDITSLLPSLIILSVKNCGLKTLDGTLAFPNLQKLYASDNQLTHAIQCSLLPELQELDLSGNPIESLDGFRYLGVLNFLRIIKLYDTKVCEIRYFHMELRRLVPSLRDIYPKSTTGGGLYDLDLDDDDLEIDTSLLGDTDDNINTQKPPKPRQANRSLAGSGDSIRRRGPKRSAIIQNISESSEADLKLQSLIATVGDSETEGDAEQMQKKESLLKEMKELNETDGAQQTEGVHEGGIGDVAKEEPTELLKDVGETIFEGKAVPELRSTQDEVLVPTGAQSEPKEIVEKSRDDLKK